MKNRMIIPTWPLSNKVKAFSTNRIGGISQPPYDALNLAHHVGDDPLAVRYNRQLLIDEYGLPEQPLWVKQVADSKVLEIPVPQHLVEEYYSSTSLDKKKENKASKLDELFAVDALYTSQLDTVCAVLTADCVPILLCNNKETEVAAIHAGWKGVVKGIIQNTVFNTQAINDKEDFLYAWIGPAIGPESFVVGPEVLFEFAELDPSLSDFFKPYLEEEGKWLADLPGMCSFILQKCGLKKEHIYQCNIDTKTDLDFFSYRRDRTTGRFATMIWLEDKSKLK